MIPNMYFYIEPHDEYDGKYGLVSWDVTDYCVIMYRGFEYLIVTPNSLPPNKLTLQIGQGDFRDGGYAAKLKSELNKLNVKYSYR